MDKSNRCAWCDGPIIGRRADAVTCTDSHKTMLSQYGKPSRRQRRRWRSSNSTSELAVNPQSRGNDAFYGMIAQPEVTEETRALFDRQKRNPGVLIPELQGHLLEQDMQRRRHEAASQRNDAPLGPQDRFSNPDPTVLGRMAATNRRVNRAKHRHPDSYVMRGNGNYDEEPGTSWTDTFRNQPRHVMP
jgi:hypothetical protein